MPYKVFLSSCYTKEMQINRDLFRAELLARFNIISGQIGENTYLVDFEYGIPYNTPEKEVIDICVSNVRTADLFFCILGKQYGHMVKIRDLPSDLKNLAVDFGYRKIYEKISVLELEILTALFYYPDRSVFFLQGFLKRDKELDRLLHFLEKQKCNILMFNEEKKLLDIAVKAFSLCSKFSAIEANKNLNQEHQKLFARKLRYYVPQKEIQNELDRYVNSDSTQMLIIQGAEGVGKTTALANWILQNQSRKDLDIFSWFQEVDTEILSTALLQFLNRSGISTEKCYYQEDCIFLFHQMLKSHYSNKRVFILDGLDDINEVDPISWLVTSLDPSVKLILTTRISDFRISELGDSYSIEVSPVSHKDVIRQIYQLEGKQLEYPNICKFLESVCRTWTLKQISVIIQHFLRVIKYDPTISKDKIEQRHHSILEYLELLSKPGYLFKDLIQYMSKIVPAEQINHSIDLMICSERGLSLQEISDLCDNPGILYQFYFLLEISEDLYRLPLDTEKELLHQIDSTKEEILRKQLVKYFCQIDNDRARIELCYQYVKLRWTEPLISLLSSVKVMSVIEANSSLYFNELASALTTDQWNKLIQRWELDLHQQPDKYSEQEINAIYTTMTDLGKIRNACGVMNLLVKRGGDNFSLASYHQNLATLYDDLDDIQAVEQIDMALEYLDQSEQDAFIQNKIDTCLAAATIYSHFQNVLPQWRNKQKEINQQVEGFIDQAINLTDLSLKSNAMLRSLSYHNIAYTCWQMNWLDRATIYIEKALDLHSPNVHSYADSLYLKAMVFLDRYFDTQQQRLISEAKDAIEQCYQKHMSIIEKYPIDHYKFQLVNVYDAWAQILCQIGEFSESIKKIDEAISLEKLDEDAVEHYLTCYHSASFRLCAYDNSPEPILLKEALEFAQDAKEDALRYPDSADAKDALLKINTLIEEIKSR